MPEEKMSQIFRLKKIDEIRNYLIQEINRNQLMSNKHKKVRVITAGIKKYKSINKKN